MDDSAAKDKAEKILNDLRTLRLLRAPNINGRTDKQLLAEAKSLLNRIPGNDIQEIDEIELTEKLRQLVDGPKKPPTPPGSVKTLTAGLDQMRISKAKRDAFSAKATELLRTNVFVSESVLSQAAKAAGLNHQELETLKREYFPKVDSRFIEQPEEKIETGEIYTSTTTTTATQIAPVVQTQSRPTSLTSRSTPSAAQQLVGNLAAQSAASIARRTLGARLSGWVTGLFVGVSTGPFAPIVGFVTKELVSKGVEFLIRHKRIVYVIIGVFTGSIVTVFVGAGATVGALLGGAAGFAAGTVGGAASILSGITNGVIALIGFLVFQAAGALAKIMVVTFLIIIVLTVLVLYIINSGAYITPPSTIGLRGSGITSPYIDVKKEASPSGPFENGGVPSTITFTITVTAKKGALSNIRFENVCTVTTETGNPPCDVPTPPDTPDVISPTSSFTFTYDKDFSSPDYNDSFISDTFTVTANVEEQENAVASAVETIKIGEPPEDCPSGWPVASGEVTVGVDIPGHPTHGDYEAIDIGNNGVPIPILATHKGIAKIFDGGPYGKHVKVLSSCNGTEFISMYAHMSLIGVSDGEEIQKGTQVGLMGTTGNSSGIHLHYEFRVGGYDAPSGDLYPDQIPYMGDPYIPAQRDQVEGCTYVCGLQIP